MGRSRGGFSTKIHAGCINENTLVSIAITGGERNDAPGFEKVFDNLPKEHNFENAVMDKAYDSDKIREKLGGKNINAVIPPKKNRKEQISYDKERYKLRNKVERFFSKLKQFRRVATRYEKLGETFLAFVQIAASCIMAREFVNTA